MRHTYHLSIAEAAVELLDNKFSIGRFRFGLDPILGLMPGVGDLLPAAISFYLIYIGFQEKIAPRVLLHMLFNTLVDLLVGSVPIIGDAIDFWYKSHSKNLALLKQELSPVVEAGIIAERKSI